MLVRTTCESSAHYSPISAGRTSATSNGPKQQNHRRRQQVAQAGPHGRHRPPAGVSQQAVSVVLSGDDSRIGAKTAAKIRRIAKKLRYHPEPRRTAARRQTQRHHRRAGLPLDDPEGSSLCGLAHPHRSPAQLTALAAELEPTPESLDRYIDQCMGWNIDGLIFLALENDPVWPGVAKAAARLPRVVSIMGNLGLPNGSTRGFGRRRRRAAGGDASSQPRPAEDRADFGRPRRADESPPATSLSWTFTRS